MKQLFFDFDGTIANSEPGIVHSIKYMLQKMGLPELSQAQYRTFIGPALNASLRRYYPQLDEQAIKQAILYYQELYTASAIFEAALYPGIKAALATLQNAGYRLNIASAKPEPMVKRLVAHFDLGRFFAGVYGATLDESVRSTKTAVLAYGLAQSQAQPRSSVMIGDRDTDMLGGYQNHVPTLGVAYGFGQRQELMQAHANLVVAHPDELPAGVVQVLAQPMRAEA
ncbi:HAD hydrolase-like protein [Lacticaseibacillus baoqingensis]|uniref:HAD hydrolase-like protein n=1 Tax=Lacticaseibacillus baoqingensis TaxID=2486013 RepID=A0ABW4E5P8_9LACO|nr:HAD hydrolase-like protein [Lacticaseibacillus baoqingensis]